MSLSAKLRDILLAASNESCNLMCGQYFRFNNLRKIIAYMKKKDLKAKTNLIKEYLFSEGILYQSNYVFKMDFFPDFDYTDYQKGICQPYYFHEKIDFSEIFSDILSYSELEPHIFPSYERPGFLQDSLNQISVTELKKLEENDAPLSFDSFCFQKAHLYSIDNVNKTLNYDCTCETEGSLLGEDFVSIYFTLNLCGIIKEIGKFDLYNQLIVDSYRKYLNKDYRMAYFLMFSAFECCINYNLNSDEEEKRLLEKKNELFKSKFSILNANTINSSVDMKKYEEKRNSIAHGREKLSVDKELVDDLYFDFISLIVSYNQGITSYTDLSTYLMPS